ncbi:hypothetical protein AVEN_271523-1 [Araneus ventricosus]|uniref:Uncharacterized protein n=1 Tax=Araneus ventricosus TaxID=182803 RepID=A0A4Y2G1M6_ARAVE|nr:hypothetical protein AVEN_271523-1 [Araneus ventricosus]
MFFVAQEVTIFSKDCITETPIYKTLAEKSWKKKLVIPIIFPFKKKQQGIAPKRPNVLQKPNGPGARSCQKLQPLVQSSTKESILHNGKNLQPETPKPDNAKILRGTRWRGNRPVEKF